MSLIWICTVYSDLPLPILRTFMVVMFFLSFLWEIFNNFLMFSNKSFQMCKVTWTKKDDLLSCSCLSFLRCIILFSSHMIKPSDEVMVLFILRKIILQTHMHSQPVRLDVWFSVGPFVYFHTSCVQTPKALVRLHKCTSLPKPSLVAYVISTIISWAGSIIKNRTVSLAVSAVSLDSLSWIHVYVTNTYPTISIFHNSPSC